MILVVAEHRDGKLNRATLETIAAAQTTSGRLVMWLEFIVVTAFATDSGPAMKPTRQPGMP